MKEKFTCDHTVSQARTLLNERGLKPQEEVGAATDVSDRSAQNTYSNAKLKEDNQD